MATNPEDADARDAAEAAIEDLRKRGGVFVDAVRATRMPMALTDPSLRGNPIVFANKAFLRLSGYRMEEVLGQQPRLVVPVLELERRDRNPAHMMNPRVSTRPRRSKRCS